jgi:predicted nucleotidyltransferase
MQGELVEILDPDVELVIKGRLKPRIKPHVLADAEVVYAA